MLRHNEVVLLFSLLFLYCEIVSQTYVFHPHAFGANLFAGGIDTPRFQFTDIDGDGDADLFLLDRDDKLWFYRNTNQQYILEQEQTFTPPINGWFQFVDIDNDGDVDCFTNNNPFEISLYENVGNTENPIFQKSITALKDTSGNGIFVEASCVPAFADIDADGDLDFFTGSSIGSVSYYKNVGTSFSPLFAFVTNSFDNILIIGGTVTLSKAMHGASGIEFFDADSNGTLDLFWGDYFNQSLYYLKNIGTPHNAHFLLTDSTYPKEHKVQTFGFNIPQHVDIDADGFFDLMVGSVYPTGGYNNFWYYRNIGSNAAPFYSLQTKNFIPMLDVGTRSTVASADFDSDGDVDLAIGAADGTVKIFLNEGTATEPLFATAPAYQFSTGGFYAGVASGNLNGDAKPDLLVGRFSGDVKYYSNSSVGGSIQFELAPFQLDTIGVGNNAMPCIADIDGDNVHDIVIGNSAGVLYYYKNVGSNSAPLYVLEPTYFNFIDVGSYAAPFVKDLDGDGRVDLLIGNSEGKIYHYEFNSSIEQFNLITSFFGEIDVRLNAAPAFVDIDSDGDEDLFMGNGKGGIYFFENVQSNSILKDSLHFPHDCVLHQNYPNPFNPSTSIQYSIATRQSVTLKVFDMLGREAATLASGMKNPGNYIVQWNASLFASGVYIYTLRAGNFVQSKRLLLIK